MSFGPRKFCWFLGHFRSLRTLLNLRILKFWHYAHILLHMRYCWSISISSVQISAKNYAAKTGKPHRPKTSGGRIRDFWPEYSKAGIFKILKNLRFFFLFICLHYCGDTLIFCEKILLEGYFSQIWCLIELNTILPWVIYFIIKIMRHFWPKSLMF